MKSSKTSVFDKKKHSLVYGRRTVLLSLMGVAVNSEDDVSSLTPKYSKKYGSGGPAVNIHHLLGVC